MKSSWFRVGALLLCARAALPAVVLVVHESEVDAYQQALQGIADIVGANSYRAVDLQKPTAARDLTAALDAKDLTAVIAVGSRALSEVKSHRTSAPVVAAMVLSGGQVTLEVPLAAELAVMRSLWPKRSRVGIIRNPAFSHVTADALEALARKEGFQPVVVDCGRPAGLLKAIAGLKGKVDFVLCFPDPDLFNPVTIKPLVLASLEDHLPLVGFSPAFVRAGAAAGIFPDYRESGRQAGELALRMERGDEPPAESGPRKLQVAINERVARLLGLDFRTAGIPVEVFR